MLIILPMMMAPTMVSAENGEFSFTFNLEPHTYWYYVDDEFEYENGMNLFGAFTISDGVDFFITHEEGFNQFVETGESWNSLYRFANVTDLDIRYRHRTDEGKIYFVVLNPSDSPVSMGGLTIQIDRLGPSIYTDLNENQIYEGEVLFNMRVEDEHFEVSGLRMTIYGDVVLEKYVDTPVESLYEEKLIDTSIYPDGEVELFLEAWDDYGNLKDANWVIYLDNMAGTGINTPTGSFTFFGAVLLIGMFTVCALPIGLVMRQVTKWESPEKELTELKKSERLYRKESKRRKKR